MSSRGLNSFAIFGAQRVLSALVAICLATAAQAQSAGSLPMTYSGRLTEATGAPKDGSVAMVATFWTAEFEGTQLGQTFEFASVILSQGVFSLYFPFMATQVQDIFRDGTEPVFIEISTSGKTYPRQKFNYVPLAMRIPVDSKSLGFDINTGKLGITGAKEAASGSVLVSNGAGGVKWDNLSSSNLTAKTQAGSDPSSDQVLTFKNGKWVAANLPPSSPTGNYLTGLVGDVIATGPGSGSASLATVAIPGTATKVTFDAKGRITTGTSLTAADIPPLSASAITSGTLPAANGGTGVSSTATFPTVGVIVTRDATETLSNKTLSGATIDGASSISGSTTINTTGAAITGTLTASTVTSQGSVTVQGNGTTANKLVLNNKDNTNYVGFKAPDTLATPLTWELPGSSGTAGQVLSTNGSGTLSWISGLAPTGAASGDLSGNFPSPTLANVGTAGAYTKVTTDAKGRVISGATLTASDLPPISATSLNTGTLAVANGGTGVGTFTNNGVVIGSSSALSSTAAGTQYNILTVNASNQPTFGTVNLASGNAVNGTLPITNGGTGAATKSGAFDALSPMTAVGDLIYGGTSGSGTRLTGNTTATKHFLSSTGTGSIANAPIWTPMTASDIPAHSAALITSGTLSVANGGTGTTTLAANSVLLGNGTSAPLTVAPGASGNILTSNGTTWVSSAPAGGSWTESGANVYRSSGNVGIGTTAPNAQLTVGNALTGSARSGTLTTNAGSLSFAAATDITLASFGFTSTNQSSLGIHGYRTAGGSDWTSTSVGLSMDVDNTPRAGGAQIWLGANGGVGINTTLPVGLLDVRGGVASAGHGLGVNIFAQNAAGGANWNGGSIALMTGAGTNQGQHGAVAIGTTTTSGKIELHGGTAAFGPGRNIIISAENASPAANWNGGHIILTPGLPGGSGATGNVGIGTTAPSAPLHVRAVGNASNFNSLRLDAATGSDTGSTNGLLFYWSGMEAARVAAVMENGDAPWPTGLALYTAPDSSGVTEKVRVTSSGRVGIGTTTPAGKLDVAGSICLNGANCITSWPAGSVTSVTAGTGLSGGPITSTGSLSLANTTVTPGAYTRANITVDAQGRLTAASSSANVALTTEVTGTLPIANGGTGATAPASAFNALSPLTTIGDILYGGASGAGTRLAGNTTTAKHFLTSTGVSGAATAPAWAALAASDIPNHSAALITSGILGVANGGTGATTLAANNVLLGNGTNAPLTVAPGTNGNVLTSNGTTWVSSAPAGGSWTTSGTDVYRSSGNVGVGTTAPAAKLQVAGGIVSTLAATLTPTGTAQTIDLATGNMQVLNLGSASGNVTLTLSNPVPGGSYAIKIVQGATARTLSWPAAVKWPSGLAMSLSTTNGAIDLVTLFYDGSNYLAIGGANFQ